MTFANLLGAALERRVLSEAELGRRLSAHRSTVNKWVEGKTYPTPALMIRILYELASEVHTDLLALLTAYARETGAIPVAYQHDEVVEGVAASLLRALGASLKDAATLP